MKPDRPPCAQADAGTMTPIRKWPLDAEQCLQRVAEELRLAWCNNAPCTPHDDRSRNEINNPYVPPRFCSLEKIAPILRYCSAFAVRQDWYSGPKDPERHTE